MLEADPEAQATARQVREWVIKAEQDLAAAELLHGASAEDLDSIICFHIQQCVEKYVKAVLALYNRDIPRTHNLTLLLNLLPPHLRPYIAAEEQARLNDYAVTARYPGDSEPFPVEEVEAALRLAKRVKAEVRAHLPRSAYR